jgi:predicted enzyme related to lactoylglutathione lyase
VGFGVNDVDAVADRVGADTGTRPKVLAFAPHGIRLLQLQDPDGNIIQLTSPLLP